MDKQQAIKLLGGSIASAAAAIGISYRAVHKWPDQLTPRIRDRVEAAYARTKKTKGRKSNVRPDSTNNKMELHTA